MGRLPLTTPGLTATEWVISGTTAGFFGPTTREGRRRAMHHPLLPDRDWLRLVDPPREPGAAAEPGDSAPPAEPAPPTEPAGESDGTGWPGAFGGSADGPERPDRLLAPATLVTEDGRIDQGVLSALNAGIREAVSRLTVEGATGGDALSEIDGLGVLAAAVAAGHQVAVAGYATRCARENEGHTGALDLKGLDSILKKGGDVGESALGPTLRLGAGTALGRIRSAVALTSSLTRTRRMLEAGEIDEARAMLIAYELNDADDAVAQAVQDIILPIAGESTRVRLRQRVREARAVTDEAWEAKKAATGPEARFIRPSPSDIPGMTDWHALIPAEESAELEAAIRSAALRLKTEGYTGTYTQARCDAFLDLALQNAQISVTLNVGVPVDALIEDDPEGPRQADEPATASEHPSDQDPAPEGPTEHDPAAEGSAAQEFATDAGEAVDPSGPPDAGRPADRPGRADRERVIPAAFLSAATGHPSDDDPQDTCTLPTARGVLVPGIGIIPVHRLRPWLDSLDTGFRRVLIDSATGLPLDIAPARYRPGARLRQLIQMRDGTCRFPYCEARAEVCDLDHVVPHPKGPTVPGNLMALCRRHHRLKTHTRWAPVLDPVTAVVTWTDPYGRTWITRPRTDHGALAVNPGVG